MPVEVICAGTVQVSPMSSEYIDQNVQTGPAVVSWMRHTSRPDCVAMMRAPVEAVRP